VAERRFEVIGDFSAAYIDGRFKGAAEDDAACECVRGVDPNLILVSLDMSK
jgi:hypothetical protein